MHMKTCHLTHSHTHTHTHSHTHTHRPIQIQNDVRETVDGIEKMLAKIKLQEYGAATRSLDLADAGALTKENAVHTLFERFLRKEDVNGTCCLVVWCVVVCVCVCVSVSVSVSVCLCVLLGVFFVVVFCT